jgi:hypothetical protein
MLVKINQRQFINPDPQQLHNLTQTMGGTREKEKTGVKEAVYIRLNPTLWLITCISSGLPSCGQSSEHLLIISWANSISGSAFQSPSCLLPPRITPPPRGRGKMYVACACVRLGLRMYIRGMGSLGSAIRTVWPRVGYMVVSWRSVSFRLPRAEQFRRTVVEGKEERRAVREG